jgi:hypothetical protein
MSGSGFPDFLTVSQPGVTTYYRYDSAGNRIGTCTSSPSLGSGPCANPSPSLAWFHPSQGSVEVFRYSKTTYDGWRFPDSTTEVFYGRKPGHHFTASVNEAIASHPACRRDVTRPA